MITPIRLNFPNNGCGTNYQLVEEKRSYLGWWLFIGLLILLIILAWLYALYTLIKRFYTFRALSNVFANYSDVQVRQLSIWNDEMLKTSIMFALILTIAGIILIPTIYCGIKS